MSNDQAKPDRFPDVFLVGAPRCGTTAMSRYLAKNPQVCFSKPKEPHFFSILLRMFPETDIQTGYIDRFFAHCDGTQRVTAEGSVSYLYSEQVIARILAINPEARFVVMVRNPIDMVYSYHARLLAILDEDQKDFTKAWNLQSERAQGRRIPRGCHDPNLLQYAAVGRMGEQLERLFALAGRDRCCVTVHDDFAADTLGAYKRVLEFMGVDYDGRTEFPRAEANKIVRFRWLQRLLKRPPKKMQNFVLTLESQEKRKKNKKKPIMRLRKWLLHKNTVELKRPPLDPEMRAIMRDAFAEDVGRLGQLLGRDFSYWLV